MKPLSLFPLALVLLFSACSTSLPVTHSKVVGKVHIGPGTEDVVLDTINGRGRLLVSCAQRRDGLPYFGEIVAYHPATGKLDTLPRIGGPTKPDFGPHGIDLVMGNDGKALLFVVNHSPADSTHPKQNSILVYEVGNKELTFKAAYTSPMLISPNDVAGLPDGSFYVTNDSKHRSINFGTAMEKIFAMRTSKIAYHSADGKWSFANDRKLAYANGIHAESDHVLVAATQKGDLAWYKRNAQTGQLTFLKDVAHIKGMDNIAMLNDHQLLVAVHPNSLKFLKHKKSAANYSPGIVYLVDTQQQKSTPVYANDGSQISANSVALAYGGRIYIGQVFEDYLLVVEADGVR